MVGCFLVDFVLMGGIIFWFFVDEDIMVEFWWLIFFCFLDFCVIICFISVVVVGLMMCVFVFFEFWEFCFFDMIGCFFDVVVLVIICFFVGGVVFLGLVGEIGGGWMLVLLVIVMVEGIFFCFGDGFGGGGIFVM